MWSRILLYTYIVTMIKYIRCIYDMLNMIQMFEKIAFLTFIL